MKKMKKIFALLLAVAMVLGMTTTAFAADGAATVNVTGTGEAAKAYYAQIVVEDRESTLGWKFVDATVAVSEDETTTIKNAFMKAFNVPTEDDAIAALIKLGLLEPSKDGPVDNYYVELGDVNPSQALGTALATIQNYATAEATNKSFTTTTIGLYLVTVKEEGATYIPMSVYVGTATDEVNVVAKGSKDEVNKSVENDGQSVSAGDEITYTVTVQYPFYSADVQMPTFTVTDILTNATFKDGSVNVKINNTNVTTGYTATISKDTVDNDKLVVDFEYNSAYAGQSVVITYTAVVSENVSAENAVVNNVTSETNSNTTGAKVVTDTVQFTVTKIDEKDYTPLAGAKFTLYVQVTKEEAVTTAEDGTEIIKEGYKALTVDDETVYVAIVDTQETDATGKTTFDGLDAQKTYYVQETKAPFGYSLNEEIVKLQGAALESSDTNTDENGVKVTTYVYKDFDGVTIEDTKLSALPSTGGIGTTIFTIGGCAIMIAAAFFFFVSRRKDA